MSSRDYGPVVKRAMLTSELQRLRRERGKSQQSVAESLGWSVSKLIRIEGGRIGISRTDLEALLRHYRAFDRDSMKELWELARGAKEKGWWDKYNIPDKAFSSYLGYEDGASTIDMFQGSVVPGMIQTEPYARLISAIYVPEKEVDRVVKIRMERNANLFERAPRQCYILDEAVIRRRVGDVMPGQLQYLAELIDTRPEITIRIIPFDAGPHFGMLGPFTLLSFDNGLDDVLYMENARGGDLMIAGQGGEVVTGRDGEIAQRDRDAVAEYRDAFKALIELALEPKESQSMILKVARDML